MEYVKQCPACIKHKTKVPLPMMTRDIPNGPWEDVATNIFTLNQKDYLLISDTFSKYPFLFKMSKKTAETTISKFQQLLAQTGPARCFLQTMDSHFHQNAATSATHYITIKQSIKTVKEAITKINFNKHTLHDVLYHLRSNPIAHAITPRDTTQQDGRQVQ